MIKKKIKVFVFNVLGKSVLVRTRKELKEFIDFEIDELNYDGDGVQINVSVEEIYESEFESLPEFEGY